MTRGLTSRLRLSAVIRLLAPVLVMPVALVAMPATGASADTGASIGVSVQVCTTAPQCYWEDDSDWGSTTAVPSGATVFWRISMPPDRTEAQTRAFMSSGVQIGAASSPMIAPATGYTYTVDAFNAASQQSAQSSPVQVTTPARSPTFVQGIAASPGSRASSLTLTVSQPVNAGEIFSAGQRCR
jgi:hypothetical protein